MLKDKVAGGHGCFPGIARALPWPWLGKAPSWSGGRYHPQGMDELLRD